MARKRTNLRKAARHTGDLYERGYQYQAAREFTIEFGPFKQASNIQYTSSGVSLGEEQHTITVPSGVIVRDGYVEACGGVTSNTTTGDGVAVGATSVVIDNTFYALMWYKDMANSDALTVWTFDGVSYTAHDSGLTSVDERVESVVWGDDVYFTHSGIANIYKYTKSGPTFAAVADAPGAGEFIFMLDNNMCVIRYNTTDDSWEVLWAVDSNPSDWSSTGSGSNTISAGLGDVRGVGFIGVSAYIVCQLGAIRMTPTGSATPAFNFTGVPEIEGCYKQYGVTTGSNKIFYVGRRNKVWTYSGGQVRPVWPITFANRLGYSKSFGCVTTWVSSNGTVTFIDADTSQYIGAMSNSENYNYSCDGPSTTVKTPTLFIFHNDSDDIKIDHINPSSGVVTSGFFYTPHIDVGREIIIEEIDILKYGVASQMKFNDINSLYLYAWTNDGTKTTYPLGQQSISMDGLVRVPTHVACRAFSLQLIGVTDKFQIGAGVMGVRFHCRLASDEGIGRLQV